MYRTHVEADKTVAWPACVSSEDTGIRLSIKAKKQDVLWQG